MTRRKANPVAKALRTDPQYKQQRHKTKAVILRSQEDRESRKAIKDYLDGEE
jgi:hypothetical protein